MKPRGTTLENRPAASDPAPSAVEPLAPDRVRSSRGRAASRARRLSEPRGSLADDLEVIPQGQRYRVSDDGSVRGSRWMHAALRDFPEEEERLILRTVSFFWQRWRGAFTVASLEDMLGEAVVALQEVRERASALPKAAAARFIAVAICRRLRKRVVDEFRQRLCRPGWAQVELDAEHLERLEEERSADWDALVGDTLLEIVSDEKVVVALHTLGTLDQRILDLSIISGLKHLEIATRLNAGAERLPKQPAIATARAVARRYERAIGRLRELLPEQRQR